MASDIINRSFYIPDTAAFRAWVVEIRAQFEAMGWVRLTEGSPIDPVTVNNPASTGTAEGAIAGYDIFRMNDSLQATYPVFCKVEYRSFGYNPFLSIYNNQRFSFLFQLANQTDGAGNLQGYRTYKRSVETSMISNNPSSAAYNSSNAELDVYNEHWFSGDAGRFTFYFGANAPQFGLGYDHNATIDRYDHGWTSEKYSGLLNIERTRDDNGVYTGEGVHIHHCSSVYANGNSDAYSAYNKSHPAMYQYLPFGKSAQYSYGFYTGNFNCVFMNSARASTLVGNKMRGLPIFGLDGGQLMNPIMGIIGSMAFDFEYGDNLIDAYGAERVYRKPTNQTRVVQGNQYRNGWALMLME